MQRVCVLLLFLGFCCSLLGCQESPEKESPTTPTRPKSKPNIEPLELGMVFIPAGTFLMGSNDGQPDEKPVHEVYLDAYWIDKYQVTNAQFRRFVDATGRKPPEIWKDRRFNAPEQPIGDISYDDAFDYCKWVEKRLPTEAEWERAARGGLIQQQYPWGDESPEGRSTYNAKATEPVGSYAPNGYDLYDMAGNVWEWCSDWYDPHYYKESPRENPKGPLTAGAHVVRGGAWNSDAKDLRVANRNWSRPAPYIPFMGFRCVRVVEEDGEK